MGRIIYYLTDVNGNFSITELAPGEYKVLVIKEEDRHPILTFSSIPSRVADSESRRFAKPVDAVRDRSNPVRAQR